MDNIRFCEICGAESSLERFEDSDPVEGEVCESCDRWICNDCVDWKKSCRDDSSKYKSWPWIICKNCSEEYEL